ncbi:hypothetical protein BH20ACI1_BH20ACI1_26480 [soil metagenome]
MKFIVRLSVFAVLMLAILTVTSINFFDVSAQADKEISPAQRENAYRANNIGVAYLEQFDYSKASESFRQSLKIDPKLKIANINLAIALFNAQDIEGAFKAAKTAAELAPEKPQPAFMLGLIARTQNRTEEAVAFFQKVLKFRSQRCRRERQSRTDLYSTAKLCGSGKVFPHGNCRRTL